MPYNTHNYTFVFIYLRDWFLTAIHTSKSLSEFWEHSIFL